MRVLEAIFGVQQASGIFATLLEVLPYLLLALLVFLLIKFFLKLNAQSLKTKAKQGEVILSEEERIIKTEDIGQLIKVALTEKNYRLAVRYYYLQILKQLSEKNYIDWQLQKTNSDYLTELNQEHLKLQFAKITILYDYIWYGDFTIDEAKFLKAEASFKNLQKSLLGHG